MTRLLIAGDSHGKRQALEDLVYIYEDKVDLMLHTGDSEFSGRDPLWDSYETVKGNNDFGPGYEESKVLTVNDTRLFITHGHRHNVNRTVEKVAEEAVENNAPIAFYGHTHKPLVEKSTHGILTINPGSISQPRGAVRKKLYALVEINEDIVKVTYHLPNTDELKELRYEGKLEVNK